MIKIQGNDGKSGILTLKLENLPKAGMLASLIF